MNVTYITKVPNYKGLAERFSREHPEYLVPGRSMFLDYRHQAVRDYAVAIARELITKYDADGINLDFARFANNKVFDEASLVDVVRRIHEVRQTVAAARSRPITIAARIPSYMYATTAAWSQRSYGGEHPWFTAALKTWAANGWIDRAMVCCPLPANQQTLALARYKAALSGTRTQLWGDLYVPSKRSANEILNTARSWVKQGVDGGFFFYKDSRPEHLPHIDWRLRLIDHPEARSLSDLHDPVMRMPKSSYSTATMAARFRQINRDTPFLLPPDMRDWVPEDDLAHFVLEAVETVPLSKFRVNDRGTGSEQYPPHMMLALLIYCYANGIFPSRRIERATYRDLGVRFVTGNTHPDHDSICTFRRENFEAVSAAFLEVLKLAHELKFLKVGTISVDGTHIKANASKYHAVTYERACELERQLELEITELMAKAEESDSSPRDDGQRVPEELAHREALREKVAEARCKLEQRAAVRAEAERPEYERKVAEREERTGSRKGPKP
ncbi:MAG: hypothetical protein HN396_18640, partial [Gemmatimonadales bacterium]|nr:hypothetical protein [Gemmatimonadales bacterium]